MAVATDVFVLAVLYGLMIREAPADGLVEAGFIGHEGGFEAQVLVDDRVDVRRVRVVDVEAADLTAATVNKAENGPLVSVAARGRMLHSAVLLADVGFIRLNDLASAARRSQGLPDRIASRMRWLRCQAVFIAARSMR